MKIKDRVFLLLKKRIWYIFLLMLSSIYVMHYKNEIYQLKEINARNLIFILWLIILLFPLFSEIELLGVKLKKEIEKTKEEVKDKINDLHMLITDLKVSNSNANTINLGNGFLPNDEKLQELLKEFISNTSPVEDNKEKNPIQERDFTPKTEYANFNSFDIAEESKYLFQVRLTLEKILVDLCEKTDYVGHKSMYDMIRHLIRIEIINGKTADLLNQIIKIANRGVHGEIVSDEYIVFINKVLPELQKQLNEVKNSLYGFICPRCKHYVYSRYENVCPNCGFINEDD